MCAMSWCDLDLTFDVAVVTYKILVGVQRHGLTLI